MTREELAEKRRQKRKRMFDLGMGLRELMECRGIQWEELAPLLGLCRGATAVNMLAFAADPPWSLLQDVARVLRVPTEVLRTDQDKPASELISLFLYSESEKAKG